MIQIGGLIMIVERIGIYVYFKQNKFIRQLKRHGHLIYVNKDKKYALIYVDKINLEKTLNDLSKLKFVTNTLVSEYPNISREYSSEDYEKKDYRIV